MHTQIGIIAEMLQAVESEPTPLQRRLDALGKTLGWAALFICGLVFLAGWLQGNDPLDMFMISVGLAIAAVPEGLPAVVTISLALGMREMIKRHALIRRLSSVETLGSATVICSDKTGTLTQNEMTVARMWVDGVTLTVTGSGYAPAGDFLVEGAAVDLKDAPGVKTTLWVAAGGSLRKEKSDTSTDACLDGAWAAIRGLGGPWDKNTKMPSFLKRIFSWHPYFWAYLLRGDISNLTSEVFKRTRSKILRITG